jgi:hypothetical protein
MPLGLTGAIEQIVYIAIWASQSLLPNSWGVVGQRSVTDLYKYTSNSPKGISDHHSYRERGTSNTPRRLVSAIPPTSPQQQPRAALTSGFSRPAT